MKVVKTEFDYEVLKQMLNLPKEVTIDKITEGRLGSFYVYLSCDRFKEVESIDDLRVEIIEAHTGPFVTKIGDHEFVKVEDVK